VSQPLDSDLTPGLLPWILSAVAVIFFLILMVAVVVAADDAKSGDNAATDGETMQVEHQQAALAAET